MTLFVLIYIFFLAFGVHWFLHPKTLRKVYLAEKVPGPIALPILGNAFQFSNKSLAELFTMCDSWISIHGDIFRMWVGGKLTFNFSHPIEAEAIFTSSKFINKSELYDFFRDWLNEGLLTSKDKKWHARRKILTPAFHFKILDQYVEIFDRQSNTMMHVLSKFGATGDAFDMHRITTLYTLDVICEATMGITLNAQTNNEHEYAQAVEELTYLTNKRMFSPVLRLNLLYMLSPTRRKINKCLRTIHTFTESLIVKRRELLVSNQNSTNIEYNNPDEDDVGTKKRKYNFIDILLNARIDDKPLSNLDIREEVDTFVFEGHDTTSSAITFSLYHIAKYPDVQRKCVQEIIAVLGVDKQTPITMGLLNSLPYMDTVIKETLRLYPSVPAVGRFIEHEVTINGHTYPANSHALVNLYEIHRNPKLYENPHQFRPERFAQPPMYTGQGKAFAYVPFSAGSRNCIGQKFAELELKSILTKVLRYYEVSLHPDSVAVPRLNMGMVFKTEEPLMFYVKARDLKCV